MKCVTVYIVLQSWVQLLPDVLDVYSTSNMNLALEMCSCLTNIANF